MNDFQVTIVTVAHIDSILEKVIVDLKEKYNFDFELRLYYLQDNHEFKIDLNSLGKDLISANFIFLDLMGVNKKLINFICSTVEKKENAVIPANFRTAELRKIARFNLFSLHKSLDIMKKMALGMGQSTKQKSAKMMELDSLLNRLISCLKPEEQKDGQQWVQAYKYWINCGEDNLKNLFLLLGRNYQRKNLPIPELPKLVPTMGLTHPETERLFNDPTDYLKSCPLDQNKPTIGILYYFGRYGEASRVGLKALCQRLAPFCNLIPVFFYSVGNQKVKALKKYFYAGEKILVDAVINLLAFRLDVGPMGGDPSSTITGLKELNVPIFHPIPMNRREIKEWEKADSLSPAEVIIQVILPELDGCIEPIPISGLEDRGFSKVLNRESTGLVAIEERVEKIARRVLSWVKLKKKQNSEKKIALILYNYPPGEDNLGGAGYLDVFASIQIILGELKRAGYFTGDLPQTKLQKIFLEKGIVNSGKWFSKELTAKNNLNLNETVYNKFFNQIPKREMLVNEWGDPPGKVMTIGDEIIIPGIFLGNIFIGLQPSRGLHENPEKVYHDKSIPPHYQYMAFYKWLDEEWGADACIHVGTHGTLEFTSGKEVGLSGQCFPDYLIGNMPHLYFYYVANPSEAMIAKRRSLATLINYSSPPVTVSGLYEELAELEILFDEYHEASLQDPLRSERVKKAILEKAKNSNFSSDQLEEIHTEIFRIKRSMIPKGLHILGKNYTMEEIIDFVTVILRYDRGDVLSLNRLLCQLEGIDYDQAIHNPSNINAGKSYGQILSEIDFKAHDIVKCSLSSPENELNLGLNTSKQISSEIKKSLHFGTEVAKKVLAQVELEALLQGLNAEYIPSNIGGDPIRTPEVLPTGRNTHQFDPRLVPTEAAYLRGREIAENTITHYYDKYCAYPKSTAIILWGFETAKTQGETVGQILSYLGVRVVRKKNIWEPQLEIIPLEELGRPRIDVVINMCGFFRDLFSNVMELLDEAFNMVIDLDEPLEMNYLKENAQQRFADLIKEMDEKTAWTMAKGRIFGPAAGEYGTNLQGLIETRNWTEETQLANLYLQRMNHLYTHGFRAQATARLLEDNLAKVEVISQIRSSYDYEITDLDHYYEYFGGLAKSVEVAAGKKPEMLFTDTTKEVIITEDVEKAINRGVRTRLLNPKWVDYLLEHDYHGGQQISDRIENVLGLAATTNRVENWIWSNLSEKYIFNQEMRNRLKENNRWATAEIIGRLHEAHKRGYWQASKEEVEKLRDAYLELEGLIEEDL